MYTISSLKQGNIDIPPFLKETEDQFNPFQGWQDSNQSKKGDIFRSSYNQLKRKDSYMESMLNDFRAEGKPLPPSLYQSSKHGSLDPREKRPSKIKMSVVSDMHPFVMFDKVKFQTKMTCLFGLSGLVLSIIEHEEYYFDDGKKRYESTDIGKAIKFIVTVTTLVQVIFKLQSLRFKKKIVQMREGGIASTWSFSEIIFDGFQILFLCVQPLPTKDYFYEFTAIGIDITYSVNQILLQCMLFTRGFLVLDLLCSQCLFMTSQAAKICLNENFEANKNFALKALLKYYPFRTLGLLIIVSTLVLAMAIRLAELPAYQNIDYADPRYQDFTYIWNGVWLAFVTLTTVGYGDFYPITHLGRFLATIAAFWGIFLISMIISVTSEGLSLNDLEKREIQIQNRAKERQQLKQLATRAIQAFYRSVKQKVNHKSSHFLFNLQKFSEKTKLLKQKKDIPLLYLFSYFSSKVDLDCEILKSIFVQKHEICQNINLFEKELGMRQKLKVLAQVESVLMVVDEKVDEISTMEIGENQRVVLDKITSTMSAFPKYDANKQIHQGYDVSSRSSYFVNPSSDQHPKRPSMSFETRKGDFLRGNSRNRKRRNSSFEQLNKLPE